MGKIDKHFAGMDYTVQYDFRDKKKNVTSYVKYMLNRSLAMFQYHNLPETIPAKELEKLLQCNGYCGVTEVNGKLYAFNGSFGGEGDVYQRPTKYIISNPALNYSKEHTIDTDVIIIPSDSMYMGLIPMYEKYCTMLNESDITIILATINKRVQNLLSANDDNTVASAKKFLQDIEDGKLGVIAETKLFDSFKVNSSSNSANVDLKDLFEMHQYIKASMFNEIGLGANNNMKRERLAVAEVEVNSDNLYPLVDDMLECRRKALEKINAMFGTDIQVEFNSSWDYRMYQGEPINTESEGEGNVEVAEDGGTDEPSNEDATIETTDEPTTEPTTEPNVEPTEEPKEEKEVDSNVEPTSEPTVEDSDEPTDEGTDEPDVDSSEDGVEVPAEEDKEDEEGKE